MIKNKKIYLILFVCSLFLLFLGFWLPGPVSGIYRAEIVTDLEKNAKGYLIIKNDHHVYAVNFTNSGRKSLFLGNWKKEKDLLVIDCNGPNQKQLVFKAYIWGIRWMNPPPEEDFFKMVYSFRVILYKNKIQKDL